MTPAQMVQRILRDPPADLLTSIDMVAYDLGVEIHRQPASTYTHGRVRPDDGQWVADVGTGGATQTVGTYPTAGLAERAVRDTIGAFRTGLTEALVEAGDPLDRLAPLVDKMPVRIADLTPVGLAEIGVRLGVEAQTARNWRTRGVLPEPEWVVSGSPAWSWATIEQWARDTGRL